jgi:hypothetical protein
VARRDRIAALGRRRRDVVNAEDAGDGLLLKPFSV